eukprot:s708_g18.t1
MEEINGRITDSGQPVTTETIPSSSFHGAWVQDPSLTLHQLIVPSGPDEIIRSERRPCRYVSREQIISEAQLRAEEVSEEDAEAAEISDIIAGFENNTIRSGTAQEKQCIQQLLTYILDHKKAPMDVDKEDEIKEEVKEEEGETGAIVEDVHRDLEGFTFNGIDVVNEGDEEQDATMDEPVHEEAGAEDLNVKVKAEEEQKHREYEEHIQSFPMWAHSLTIGSKKMLDAAGAVVSIDPDKNSNSLG